MPNSLAYLMLSIWPLVCIYFFRKFRLERAIIWSILGAYLLLPPATEFDFPLVPDLTKVTVPNLSAFLIVIFLLKMPVKFWPDLMLARLLFVAFVAGVVPTVLTNGDPIIFSVLGNTTPISFETARLPGLGLRDLFSVTSNQFIILMPFLLARQYLSTEKGLRELLLALVIGALLYSLPALVEIRLSPQINVWVYGFFQHSFEQMMRDGGFRPIVFLPHALWLVFLFMTAALAAVALSRESDFETRNKLLVAAVYLFVMVVLCKSLASFAYSLVLLPFILVASPKWMIRVSTLFVVIAVIYPILRENGLVPLDAILQQAEAINPDRARSLGYRFENEELLLEHSRDKRLFGWGGWGRNLVREEETARILSIPDGEWIIVFGTFGWLGYIAKMGLLSLPVLMLFFQMRGWDADSTPAYVGPLALILSITMIDMLLNAVLTPYTWLIAGALLGYCERQVKAESKPTQPQVQKGRTVIDPGHGDFERSVIDASSGGPRSNSAFPIWKQ